MILSDAEAKALLTSPKNLTARHEAIRWQNRVRFHGLTTRDKAASAHWPHFKKWVYGFLLVDDKRKLFDQIFPFPVPTTRLLAEVHDHWMKVFDGVNPELVIEGSDGLEADYLAYLDSIGESDFWPDEYISALFESHNDLLLIDLKPTAAGRPQPYLTRLSIDSVISLELNPDATATHVVYKTADGSWVVVDDTTYRVYTHQEQEYELKDTFVHGLGYCPARLLWDERVANHPVASASPVDEVLAELDSYAAWHVFYDMFKLYGAFPIYYGAEQAEAPPAAPVALPRNADGTIDAGFEGACSPKSAPDNNFVAPGEYWEMPFGSDLSIPPVGIVEPSTTTLEFHAEDRERMYTRLVAYLVGKRGESATKSDEAMNEKQIAGNFSSEENVLRFISRHASAARQWGLLTMGKLRYTSALKSISFTFGTEFYLQTEAELWDGLTKARTAGSPQAILSEKIRGIQSFRLRSGGNPTRSQILLDLEPLPEQSLPAVAGLAMSGVVSMLKYAVKANFTDLIAQMERELAADVVLIGSGFSYAEKINQISKYLYAHVTIEEPRESDPGDNPGANRPAKRTAGNR